MSGQPFAFVDSPATLAIYVRIARGSAVAYTTIDMRDVTTVSALVKFADGTSATWTLTPDGTQTTAAELVAYKAFATGDTDLDKLGNATIVATGYIGTTPLPPAEPRTLPIRLPSLQ